MASLLPLSDIKPFVEPTILVLPVFDGTAASIIRVDTSTTITSLLPLISCLTLTMRTTSSLSVVFSPRLRIAGVLRSTQTSRFALKCHAELDQLFRGLAALLFGRDRVAAVWVLGYAQVDAEAVPIFELLPGRGEQCDDCLH